MPEGIKDDPGAFAGEQPGHGHGPPQTVRRQLRQAGSDVRFLQVMVDRVTLHDLLGRDDAVSVFRSNGGLVMRMSIPKRLRFAVFRRDNFTCRYCGQKPPDVILHIDHVVPVVEGGRTDLDNLVTCCRDCNLGKSDTLLEKRPRDEPPLDDLLQIMRQGTRVEIHTEIDWWHLVASHPDLEELLVDIQVFAWLADRLPTVCPNTRWFSEGGFLERFNVIGLTGDDEWFAEWQLRERLPDCRGCDCSPREALKHRTLDEWAKFQASLQDEAEGE